MKIGLDFDGVIANTPALKAFVTKEHYNVDIDPHVFGTPYVTDARLLSRDLYNEIRDLVYNNKDIATHLKPIEGAEEYIKKLQSEGHSVEVVTSRFGPSVEIAKEWLAAHGIPLKLTAVGLTSKRDAAQHLDLFIDDLLLKLYEIKDVVPHLYLYSWGYNEIYREDAFAKRVFNWEEFYNHVNKLQ